MALFKNNYLKAKFMPIHPEKCINYNGKLGKVKEVEFRSSWEKIFCNYCDLNKMITEWGSEVLEIPYVSSVDGKIHRYITDFVFTAINADGKTEDWVIEIKPQSQIPKLNACGQIIFPELSKKKKITPKRLEAWQEMCDVLKKNKDKWDQAKEWCKRNNKIFKVISEENLALNME